MALTPGRSLRIGHKWLAALIGIQLSIWSVTGVYMVSMDLDFIHGDSLVRDTMPPIAAANALLPIATLTQRYGELTSVRLRALPGFATLVYELATPNGRLCVDAVSGKALSPLPEPTIRSLALAYYAGTGRIARTQLLETMPVEARGRPAPLWRVDFDDHLNTSFYLDPDTGSLITRRHRWWRVFDTFWMLHVMDYGAERDDVNNLLLRVAAVVGTIFGLTGLCLLFFSFRRPAARGRRTS